MRHREFRHHMTATGKSALEVTSQASPQIRPNQTFSLAHMLRALGMLVALAIIWIAFDYATGGVFLRSRNFSNLMRQTAATGILSVGMLMVIVAGEIDLSVGSLVGLTGMLAAMVQASRGWGLAATLLAACSLGALIGLLQGATTAYARVPSFIVTLGGLLAWRGVTKGISGGVTIPTQLEAFNAIGQSYLDQSIGWALAAVAVIAIGAVAFQRYRTRRRLGLATRSKSAIVLRTSLLAVVAFAFVAMLNRYEGVPVPVLGFVLIAITGAFVMRNTIFGRYLYAIGGNREAARLSGIDTRKMTVTVFGIMGLLAAIAGIIYTARVGSASPDAGLLLELDAIAACVIGGASLMGGRGAVFGACVGALFMASLDNGMSLKNVADYIQDIVKGGVLIIAVALDMLGRKRAA
jgi:D-xylose transport system permease protein